MAFNPPAQPSQKQQPANQPTNIVTASLGNAFKTQTGEPMSAEQIAQLLIDNMDKLGELAKQGKLTQVQITQVRVTSLIPVSIHDTLKKYADRHKATHAAPASVAAAVASSSAASTQGTPMTPVSRLSAAALATPPAAAFKTQQLTSSA